jgi:hypothetical protein
MTTQWTDSITNNPLPYNASGMEFFMDTTDEVLIIDQLTSVAWIDCNSTATQPVVVLPEEFKIGAVMFISNKGSKAFILTAPTGEQLVQIEPGTFWVVSLTLGGYSYIPINGAITYAINPMLVAGGGLQANDANTELNVQGVVYWVNTALFPNSTYTIPLDYLESGNTIIGKTAGGTWILPTAGIEQVGKTLNLKNSSPEAITVTCPSPTPNAYALDYEGQEIDPYINQSIILMPNDSLVLVFAGSQFDAAPFMYYVLSNDNPTSNILTETSVKTPITRSSPVNLTPYTYLKDSISFEDLDPVVNSKGPFVYLVPKPVPHIYFISSNLRGTQYSITIKFAGGGPGKQITLSPSDPFMAISVNTAGFVAGMKGIV